MVVTGSGCPILDHDLKRDKGSSGKPPIQARSFRGNAGILELAAASKNSFLASDTFRSPLATWS